MKYFLVGIKGTGMSALASYLKQRGEEVLGSDIEESFFTEETLRNNDIEWRSFSLNNLKKEYFYIISSSYSENNNEEVKWIKKKKYKYKYYSDFIASLNHKVISIAGTHGKTTTSSLVKQMIDEQCSYIIGDGEGGYYPFSPLLVLEACEYKNHFLKYHSSIGVITCIEEDHLDFFKNLKDIYRSFKAYASHCSSLIYNGDLIKKRIKKKNTISFGFSYKNDAVINIISKCDDGYYIELNYKRKEIYHVPFKGRHMIYNFVASLLVVKLLDKEYEEKKLVLPKRRMNISSYQGSLIVDDYAHHPVEVESVISSLREMYPYHKITGIFQFHSYQRAIYFKKEFKRVFSLFDKIYLSDVYVPKREKENKKEQLKIDKIYKEFSKYNELVLLDIGSNQEIFVFMGAGTIYKEIEKLNDVINEKNI